MVQLKKFAFPVAMLASMTFGAGLMGVASSATFTGERDMVRARVALHDVIGNLSAVQSNDFGGHRAQAIVYANKSLGEIDAAIHYTETHR